MGKKYIFDLGIEARIEDPLDDLFEVEIELTQEEHDRIYAAYVEYMWDEYDLAELFRDYLPDLEEKIIAVAEPVAVKKWGDAARRENGARFTVCDPGFIQDEYEGSEDERVFREAQRRMKDNCKRQSRYEHDLLISECGKGRWPHLREAGSFKGLFACFCATGSMKADYSMECQCNGMHVDYCKRYTLKGSKMEIRLYGSKSYGMSLIDDYLRTCGRDVEVKDMTGHYLVYVPAREDESDIAILMAVLDRLESDTNVRRSSS